MAGELILVGQVFGCRDSSFINVHYLGIRVQRPFPAGCILYVSDGSTTELNSDQAAMQLNVTSIELRKERKNVAKKGQEVGIAVHSIIGVPANGTNVFALPAAVQSAEHDKQRTIPRSSIKKTSEQTGSRYFVRTR
ncbi:MAG: hypothetical protein PHY34_04965 [Patescibacteria group bacterium]|nr:hypothetical protein [Patescibacteria group bacterium]MDD5715539.1 hypothetical protein [Patescibacteria group bacterium]